MKTFFILCITVGILNVSCNNDAEKPDNALPAVIERKGQDIDLCYILCDFSASQGQSSRDKIIQNAELIFKIAKANHFKFTDISSPIYTGAFFEYKFQKPGIEKPSDKLRRQKEIGVQADSLHARMLRLSKAPSSNTTCIIKSLEKVASSLAVVADSNSVIKIVILSDMLEDCSFNNYTFDIDHGKYKEAHATLAKMAKPFSTFTGYKNLEITLVASSERDINTIELNKFWQAVFKKYGYDSLKPITPELPGWLDQ